MSYDFTPNQSIDYGDLDVYDPGGNKLSVSLHIQNDAWNAGVTAGLVNKRVADSDNDSYTIGSDYIASNKLYFGCAGCVYNCSSVGWTSAAMHLLAVFNGSLAATKRMLIYKDSIPQAMFVNTDADNTFTNKTGKLVLGRVNESGTLYANARMAEIALWADSLNQDDANLLLKYSPLAVLQRKPKMFFHAPLLVNALDVVNNITPTATATLNAWHPTLIYPKGLYRRTPMTQRDFHD